MTSQKWETQLKRNTKLLAYWTSAWVLSMAMATFGPEFLWKGNTVLTLIMVIFNAALGVGLIIANIRHVNDLDELQKKIQLEAMGIALGVGIVGGLSYSLLDITNLISGDAEISYLVIVISLTYLVAIVVGQKRYK